MNKIKLKVKFEEDENFLNPNFTKVAIWVATYGENVNKSDITRGAFVDAIPTLFNVPILGEWSEKIEDFKGHGGKIVIENNSVEWIQTTKAYGVVPESCNPRWEFDENNIEYLVCDGLLWSKRYEEVKKVMENLNNQSMEITVDEYEDDNGIMKITKFKFTGLCILGENTNPCFPSAKMVYSLDKDDFKKEFSLLLEEIKNIDFNNKGGNEKGMNRDEIIAKFSQLSGTEYEVIINNKDLSTKDLETQLFSLSVNDLERKIREELKNSSITMTDYWGDTWESQKYYLNDLLVSEGLAICEDSECWYRNYAISYTVVGDSVTLDYEGIKRYIRGDWREYIEGDKTSTSQVFEATELHNKTKFEETKTKFSNTETELNKAKGEFVDLQTNFTELETKFSDLEIEAVALREFKSDNESQTHKNEIDNMFEEFTEAKEIEGFNDIFEKRYDFESENLKTILKVFCYDNGIVVGKKQNKKKDTKVKFSLVDDTNKSTSTVNNEWSVLDNYKK